MNYDFNTPTEMPAIPIIVHDDNIEYRGMIITDNHGVAHLDLTAAFHSPFTAEYDKEYNAARLLTSLLMILVEQKLEEKMADQQAGLEFADLFSQEVENDGIGTADDFLKFVEGL